MADDVRPLQVAGCFEAPAATSRSSDRERAERYFAVPRVAKTAAQLRVEQWTAESNRQFVEKENAHKIEQLKADNIALQNGTLIIAADGTRLRKLPSGRLEVY
jgi:hypothetical protein